MNIKFIISGSNSSEVLESMEESLYPVASSIEVLIIIYRLVTITFSWNDCVYSLLFELVSYPICIISSVHDRMSYRVIRYDGKNHLMSNSTICFISWGKTIRHS